MSAYRKCAALLCWILVVFVSGGCCCLEAFKKPTAKTPIPVAESQAEPPMQAEPTPAPQPPLPPSPPVVAVEPPATPPPTPLPPAVAQSIEDLGEKYPGLFVLDNKKGLLYFSADALFDSGSAVVKPEAKALLEKLASILNEDEVRDRQLTIIGHTDSARVAKPMTIRTLRQLGKNADNMGLSEARAEAVASVLQADGVDASRMTTLGKGDAEPAADNGTAAGKARNRRVEVYVTPLDSGS